MLLVKDYMKELEEEVYWLRYFYSEALHYMGPASSDIYRYIRDDYVNAGNTLPKEYADEVEEDDGN